MSESNQEARLPEKVEKALAAFQKAIEDVNGLTGFMQYSVGCDFDELEAAILAALDEATEEALAVVKRYHRSLGLGKKDCCDGAVDAALIEVESALKSKPGA